jgi:hypothetical protein
MVNSMMEELEYSTPTPMKLGEKVAITLKFFRKMLP